MFEYALEVINEDGFSENDWTKLHEEDRFYNWYHGYTEIKSPYYNNLGLTINIGNSATLGVITTQHYGAQFRPELVERKLRYTIYVFPPESVKDNTNVTLHVKVEKVSMTGLASGSRDKVIMSGLGNLEADQTTAYTNFTPPVAERDLSYMTLSRVVSSEDVEKQKLDYMPGFRLRWWYTGAKVIPANEYKLYREENKKNKKQFVR